MKLILYVNCDMTLVATAFIYRYALLNDRICSEKCVRQFHHCANVSLHKPRQYSVLHT